MEDDKTKIVKFLKENYEGSYRFVKEKMFIKNFGNALFNEIIEETKFLDNSGYAFSVRVRSFVENVKQQPTCVVCNKDTIFNSNNGWQATCSRTCHMKSPERMVKLKQTNLEKYGTTNYFASEEGKKKILETNLKKYGETNYTKTKEYKDRIKSGNIVNKGNPELISKINRLNYYNSLVDGDVVMPLFPFEEYEGFSNAYKSYKWKCKKCGDEFESILKYHKYLECRKCKPTGSKMEIFIKNILDQYNIPFIYRERTILKGYEIDVYVPSIKLGIEMHGLYWHTETQKGKNLHKLKADLAEEAGIKLIQIFEDEYKQKRNIVVSRLMNCLNLNKHKIYARNCTIKEIDGKLKSEFLDMNHIQGNNNTSINLGLFNNNNNNLVSVMTFSKERLALGNSSSKDGVYELNRFCSISNTTVIGAAGKLLKYFITKYKPNEIISYADRRWSSGDLYEKIGFHLSSVTEPNYWYTKDFLNREHRFKYRKNVLSEKLEKYDPNISEYENMCNNGYARIWDCGSKKYTMKLS